MQFETLKIFCDVVRWASFSRGAAENGISQSSASQAVRQLEKRLGVELIDRSKRPLVPTRHGQLYYQGCKELVGRYWRSRTGSRRWRTTTTWSGRCGWRRSTRSASIT
jgi:DNA-binding transcriptional LysR family regulator